VKRLLRLAPLVVAAGCGGTTHRAAPPPPRLPRVLAQSWAQQADAVAQALAANDGCTAQRLAATLRAQVVAAVNAHRIAPRFQETLLSAVNDLPDRIGCTPPAPPPPKDHGKDHKEKHGKGDEGH
jgi:hypothetical protein